MTTPSKSRARAGRPRSQPPRAARLRSARAGHARTNRGQGRAAPARSPLCRAAGRAQSVRLDDLPFHGKAAPLAEPAQAVHDVFVTQLLVGAAIVADHELAFARMLDIAEGDKRNGSLDP